jgi:hypothetical protein
MKKLLPKKLFLMKKYKSRLKGFDAYSHLYVRLEFSSFALCLMRQ